jgi:signal transduction histidine kinase
VVLILEDATDRYRGREVHAGLLANAARDLEKALGPLRSALESLEGEKIGPLTPRQKQRVEEARAETGRLGEVAANLLAMSGLEESREQLHPEPVTPGELVVSAVRDVISGCQEKGVKLMTDADPEAPRVLADRKRAGLVLSSLLRNACAHTPAGGSVTVKADPWEGRVRFTVADTGEGIPSAHLERIFEPFYQVPGQEPDGVGLGLPISREIVQSHGGEIHVNSEEGRGTTVWFTLPAAVD